MAPVRARTALAGLAGDIGPEQLTLLELLISELVPNRVVHGGAGPADRVIVQITVGGDAVHGQLSDAGPGFTPADPPRPRDIGGLGLVIVDRSTSRCGTSDDGRRVWFELETTNHDQRPDRRRNRQRRPFDRARKGSTRVSSWPYVQDFSLGPESHRSVNRAEARSLDT